MEIWDQQLYIYDMEKLIGSGPNIPSTYKIL